MRFADPARWMPPRARGQLCCAAAYEKDIDAVRWYSGGIRECGSHSSTKLQGIPMNGVPADKQTKNPALASAPCPTKSQLMVCEKARVTLNDVVIHGD